MRNKNILKVLIICTLSTLIVGCSGSEKNTSKKEYSDSGEEAIERSEETAGTETEGIHAPKHNELGDISEETESIPILFSDSAYNDMIEALDSEPVSFVASEYFGLEQALEQYNKVIPDKKTDFDLLNENEKLDSHKLYDQVIQNNKEAVVDGKNSLNIMYKDLKDNEIRTFCDIITEVINNSEQKMSMKEIADTLSNLTMFEREGSLSNAYISKDMTLVYSHNASNMYDKLKDDNDNISTLEEVITHETMHLIQYGVNDGNNDNGIEAGFNRQYNNDDKTIPVDSLWYRWTLEGSAELGMARYLKIEPGTYQNNISYINSFNLCRLAEIESPDSFLENIVLNENIDEVFQNLNLETDEEKTDFLKFMYSVEITQYDTEDFWEYYQDQTNQTLTDEELTEIRKEIRTSAVRYLTSCFFSNITEALQEEKIKDLNTLFYLLRIWEMDTYTHINTEFNEINNTGKEELQAFVIWYDQIQNRLFENISKENGIDLNTIKEKYDTYTIYSKTNDGISKENCDLSHFNQCVQEYFMNIEDNFTYAEFLRIGEIAQEIVQNNKIEEKGNR